MGCFCLLGLGGVCIHWGVFVGLSFLCRGNLRGFWLLVSANFSKELKWILFFFRYKFTCVITCIFFWAHSAKLHVSVVCTTFKHHLHAVAGSEAVLVLLPWQGERLNGYLKSVTFASELVARTENLSQWLASEKITWHLHCSLSKLASLMEYDMLVKNLLFFN